MPLTCETAPGACLVPGAAIRQLTDECHMRKEIVAIIEWSVTSASASTPVAQP